MSTQQLINVGKVSGVFGIKGWLKIFSYTDDKENILDYSPWLLKKAGTDKLLKVIDGAVQGKAVIALLEGITDRDQATSLLGYDIFIDYQQLPKIAEDEYYWSQLIGLNVINTSGVSLGVVDSLLATGANDVLIVKGERERAIPFIQGQSVVTVDLQAGSMIVDWDPEF